MIINEDHYNKLLDVLLPFGKRMLDKHGEFYPYAAVVGGDDKVNLLMEYTGDERPNPTNLLEFLLQSLKKQVFEQKCQAVGLCVNMTVVDPRNNEKGDALQFIFEHQSGEALETYFPYKKKFLRGYEFAKPFAQK